MSTLITAAATARAYQVKNSVADGEIYLGDYQALPDVMIASGKMLKLPDPANSTYIHEILALCLDKDIISMYPLRQTEQQLLKEAVLLFNEYGITFSFIEDAL